MAAEIERHGFTLVHPFDDWNVIAGQGTAALELLDQAGPLDLVICPVGGGGLLVGTALAVKGAIAADPGRSAPSRRNADDARRSLEPGRSSRANDPQTIADGLRTTSLGPRTFAVISRHVDRIVTVTEAEIVDAMRFVWERIKIVIEPSSAVAVAPLLNGKLDVERAPRRRHPERRQRRRSSRCSGALADEVPELTSSTSRRGPESVDGAQPVGVCSCVPRERPDRDGHRA